MLLRFALIPVPLQNQNLSTVATEMQISSLGGGRLGTANKKLRDAHMDVCLSGYG